MEDRWNAVLGCRTSEVALTLLEQIVKLEPNVATASDAQIDTILAKATAMLAELQPTNATEALLAAQMVGAQRLAMTFLAQATAAGQRSEGADRSVHRASRLMRIFIEQTEAMAKLKGKSGQQRVVVEHVTVQSGGQAIVGAVAARKAIGVGGDAGGDR